MLYLRRDGGATGCDAGVVTGDPLWTELLWWWDEDEEPVVLPVFELGTGDWGG